MILEIIAVGLGGILIGVIIAYPIFKKTKILDKIANRERDKILKDPNLLKEKLEENSDILVDRGEKLNYSVVKNEEGKEVLDLKMEPIKIKLQGITKPKGNAYLKRNGNKPSNAEKDTNSREGIKTPGGNAKPKENEEEMVLEEEIPGEELGDD